eukprot:6307551-Amphidinium_carterae.1
MNSLEGLGDVCFRLGVEPIAVARLDTQMPPYMDAPHHYVSYYVAMYPNPDDGKVKQNVKSYKKRRTPYSDYQVALKTGICPEVHDDYVISYVETKDLALLPKNVINQNWCFPEFNFYAQCNRYSLAFEQELLEYYDRSIEHQCDNEKEHTTLTNLHRVLDGPYGQPCDLEQPNDVLTDWCRWAHAKS